MDNAAMILIQLAQLHGLENEVRTLLEEKGGKPSPLKLSDLLTEHRAQKGMMMVDVTRRSNLSRSQLRAFEVGNQAEAGIRTIQALSYGYRIPFLEVLLSTLHSQRRAPGAQPASK